MMTIKAEQEHYCLLTDGGSSWTVIERRAGKYYPLGNCWPGPVSRSMSRGPQHSSARDGVIPSRAHAVGWRTWSRSGVICWNLFDRRRMVRPVVRWLYMLESCFR